MAASRGSRCLCPSLQVQEELEAQLSRFRELLGKSPTHVDGHQHVHVLPGTWLDAPRFRVMVVVVGGLSRVGGRSMETPLCAHLSKQACVRCSPRRCRRTGSASHGCLQNVAWAAARGSKRQRAPSPAPWSAMPGPPSVPSLATACGEH